MSAGADDGEHWFEPIADHLGRAYLRYSHTKGTVQEVDHLVRALQLEPGQRALTSMPWHATPRRANSWAWRPGPQPTSSTRLPVSS